MTAHSGSSCWAKPSLPQYSIINACTYLHCTTHHLQQLLVLQGHPCMKWRQIVTAAVRSLPQAPQMGDDMTAAFEISIFYNSLCE